jgi:hypothetical protein
MYAILTNCCDFRMIFVALLFVACTNSPKPSNSIVKKNAKIDSGYRWVKIYDSARWPKSYNFQLLANDDSLIVMHTKGTWVSADGNEFVKTSLTNAINNLAFLDYVQFQQSILGLGYFNGNIEQFSFTPTIFQTTDYRNWHVIATTSNLPKRFFYHPFVFDNKIWIIGGEDTSQQYADIWYSVDGIHWIKQNDNLPFGKRSNSKIVMLHDTLYLLNNDVWRSADAIHWEIVTPEIIEGVQVFGYEAIVFDQKIWLLGCNRNTLFSSEILVSEDGKIWKEMHAPWQPRGGIAATVFKNKIYMTGGKYGGTPNHPDFRYDNDLWVLEKIQ